ncbi:MarR family transcriptional regulator [Kineosporia rhizophila]|uniref:MarR family winged helix-turn-helix transcriptional regulator n=1 Tax=Kineosporia rhizophila TaxID=84633 RepID=UPI001E2C03C1|nr:MarR family transcriptional regulator [Kineosporia rhizophila]MCE0538081.1 MarR family transcriptional regulator [Kineosporia rhizophila]
MASSWDFFDDLVRLETRLYNALAEEVRARHGISMGQFEFLSHLNEHPGSRVGDLAVSFAIGIGATSKGIDRLQNLGWVQRVPNPADRRSSLLELTEAGREVLETARGTVEERLAELLDLDAEQLAVVAAAVSALRRRLEDDQVGLPVG